MTAVRTFLILLLGLAVPAGRAAGPVRVALMPPSVLDGSVRSSRAASELVDSLSAHWTADPPAGFELVERAELRRLIEEQGLAEGFLDPAAAVRSGRLARAELAVSGVFGTNAAGLRLLRLEAVDLGSGEVVALRTHLSAQRAQGPFQADPAFVGALDADIRKLLEEANAERERLTGFLRVAFLHHAAGPGRELLDAGRIIGALTNRTVAGRPVRLVLASRPAHGFDEADLAALGLVEGDTAAWRNAADLFVWTGEQVDLRPMKPVQGRAPVAETNSRVTLHVLDGSGAVRDETLGPWTNVTATVAAGAISEAVLGKPKAAATRTAAADSPGGRAASKAILDSIRINGGFQGLPYFDSSHPDEWLSTLHRIELAAFLDPSSREARELWIRYRWLGMLGEQSRDRAQFWHRRVREWLRFFDRFGVAVEPANRAERHWPSPDRGHSAVEATLEGIFEETRIRFSEGAPVDDATVTDRALWNRANLDDLLHAIRLFRATPEFQEPRMISRLIRLLTSGGFPPGLKPMERMEALEILLPKAGTSVYSDPTGPTRQSIDAGIRELAAAAKQPFRGSAIIALLQTNSNRHEPDPDDPDMPVRPATRLAVRHRLKLPRAADVLRPVGGALRSANPSSDLPVADVKWEPVTIGEPPSPQGEVNWIGGLGREVFTLMRVPVPVTVADGQDALRDLSVTMPQEWRLLRWEGRSAPVRLELFKAGREARAGFQFEGGLVVWEGGRPRSVDPRTGAVGEPVDPALALAPGPQRRPSGALVLPGDGVIPRVVVRVPPRITLQEAPRAGHLTTFFPQEFALRMGNDQRSEELRVLMSARRRGELGRSRLPGTITAFAVSSDRLYLNVEGEAPGLATVDLASGRLVSWVRVPAQVLHVAVGSSDVWIALRPTPTPGPRLLRLPRQTLERPASSWTSMEHTPASWRESVRGLDPVARDIALVFGGCEADVVEAHRGSDLETLSEATLFLLAVAHDAQGLKNPAKRKEYVDALGRWHAGSPMAQFFGVDRRPATFPPGFLKGDQ